MSDAPHPDFIRLDQFLKLHGICGTGGQAKMTIQNGEVEINGETELRRGRKLFSGDVVTIGASQWIVAEMTPRARQATNPPDGNATDEIS